MIKLFKDHLFYQKVWIAQITLENPKKCKLLRN